MKLPAKVDARSASDRTDEWPFWMVWGGALNVTGKVAAELGYDWPKGAVLTNRAAAETLAEQWNAYCSANQ